MPSKTNKKTATAATPTAEPRKDLAEAVDALLLFRDSVGINAVDMMEEDVLRDLLHELELARANFSG
jgi:hypothetical protein